MPKTKKDLYYALADKFGPERSKRMRESLQKSPFKDLFEKEISEEEFAAELKKIEHLPATLARKMALKKPGTWGLPN